MTTTGGSNGAGIGGGRASNAGSITIYGGTVTATGKDDTAGIGGGDSDNRNTGNAGDIRIFGGTVTATSSGKGAAIGGSDYGTTKVTITGGKVRATSDSGVGIGGGGKLESDTSTVTLGYTDASKDGISITASSFSGSVKLEERFFNSKGHYNAGRVSSQNVSKLAGNVLRAWDGELRTWADLQSVIKSARNGSTIKLTQSYTALSTDSALSIPNSRALTIDLNGFTLDRGLRDGAKENGYVIAVSSTGGLTLRDSQGGGAITGGYNRGDAGGILNKGALTIENAAITGNKATGSGAGIHNTGTLTINGGSITKNASENWHGGGIYNAGTLKLKGGSITGNSAKNGQGGGILQNGKMNVSGAPVVNDNSAKTGNNIFLRLSHATIEVTGELTEGANLHVNLEDDGYGTITTGYAKYNKAHPNTVFHSDERRYPDIVQLNGEAHLTIADAGVPYISCSWKDGKLVKEEKTTDTTWISWTYGNEIPGGKYVLNSYEPTWKVEDRIYLQDDTSILLCDGKTLDVEGLYIPAGKTLTIYGQSGGTGKIYSHPDGGGAGIGGYKGHDNGSIVIHGGTIEAIGDDNCAGIGSNSGQVTGPITIYGGTITATAVQNGAGIGGGRGAGGGTIQILGGSVTATGADSSAGIGGGNPSDSHEDNSTIIIRGGTVTAFGDSKGAGIGGAAYRKEGTITINRGDVVATAGVNSAAIGGGYRGGAGKITINGGTVTANANETGSGAAIGSGSGSVSLPEAGTITITGGTVTANGNKYGQGAAIGGGGDAGNVRITISGGTIKAYKGYMSIGDGAATNNATCPVILTWTEESQDTMSIYADTFGNSAKQMNNHALTLEKGFKVKNSDTRLFPKGEYGKRYSELNGKTLVPYPTVEHTVTFDPDNGDDLKIRTVDEGDTVVRPGTPTRESYSFQGWYLVTEGAMAEKPFDFDNTPIMGDITLKAKWEISYTITIDPNIANGTVEADKSETIKGKTVTLTVTPDSGYRLDTLTVKQGDKKVPVDDSDQFTMPAGNVTVSATFVEVCTISFEAGEGEGAMESLTVGKGTRYELPDASAFTAPENKAFIEWSVKIGNADPVSMQPGEPIEVTEDAIVTAIFEVLDPVPYLEANGTERECKMYTLVTADANNWANGWYVVDEDIAIDERIEVGGNDVNLILCDGATLTAAKGISVNGGRGLTIWAQSNGQDKGALIADCGNGVTYNSTGIGGYGQDAGSITINGGGIQAIGAQQCAGIGGGSGGSCGAITINNGTVYARGGVVAAGIGSGDRGSGGSITINGGEVHASAGNNWAANIGGGYRGACGSITINGGTVDATGEGSTGIGSSAAKTGGEIIITGGKIETAGIGAIRVPDDAMDTLWLSLSDKADYLVSGGYTGHIHVAKKGDKEAVYVKDAGSGVRYTGTLTDEQKTEIAGKKLVSESYAQSFIVTFDTDGGSAVESQTVFSGRKVSRPTDPRLYGHTFKGWQLDGEDYDFETPVTGNITLTANWEVLTEPVFRVQSLVLGGEIGVNFFLELPELAGVDYTKSYMEFTVHSKNGATTRDPFDPKHRDMNGRGYYGFTCYVNAIQMAAPITAVFHYGDGRTVRKEYSVKQYIQSFESVSDTYDATTTALVHALADYGHYAQPALAHANGWTIGTDYPQMDVFYIDKLDFDEHVLITVGHGICRGDAIVRTEGFSTSLP